MDEVGAAVLHQLSTLSTPTVHTVHTPERDENTAAFHVKQEINMQLIELTKKEADALEGEGVTVYQTQYDGHIEYRTYPSDKVLAIVAQVMGARDRARGR